MKFALALLISVFFTGINVSNAAKKDQQNSKQTGHAVSDNAPKDPVSEEISPELQDQIDLMENVKTKALAVNPANLISSILKTPEDQLVGALPTLNELTQLLEDTPFGVFLENLEIVVTDSTPYLWQSVIESFPKFVGSINKVGEELAALADTEDDQLTIFDEREMGLTDLFPIADVLSGDEALSKPVQRSETKLEKLISDNAGQTDGHLKPGEKGGRN